MLLRTRRKAGFTLVELLVVVAIIATLLALLMAGVQRARVSRDQTENTHRMSKIATAVAGLKDPNNGLNLDYVPSTGFRLQSSYAQTDPEYFLLKKAWPNLDMSNTGLPNNVT